VHGEQPFHMVWVIVLCEVTVDLGPGKAQQPSTCIKAQQPTACMEIGLSPERNGSCFSGTEQQNFLISFRSVQMFRDVPFHLPRFRKFHCDLVIL
jgi:hypothetical protein